MATFNPFPSTEKTEIPVIEVAKEALDMEINTVPKNEEEICLGGGILFNLKIPYPNSKLGYLFSPLFFVMLD